MMPVLTPKSLFQKLAGHAAQVLGMSSKLHPPKGRPGEWIERLTPGERELLSHLTEADVQEHSQDALISSTWFTNDEASKQYYRESRAAFDKTILRLNRDARVKYYGNS